MRLWVAVTDHGWFDFLRVRQPEEVNFWQPGAGRRFRAIDPGELFLFKLHSPQNYIVGGGFFVQHTHLPVRLAWEAFGDKNGVPSHQDLSERIARYSRGGSLPNPVIGCNILTQPFFFGQDDWIPAPPSWSPNIVSGKRYDAAGEGAALFHEVKQRLARQRPGVAEETEAWTEHPGYSEDFLTRARLGQGAFRALVTDAYERRCAITGERTLPTLEAAHIKPYAQSGPHRIANGLLLRSDWHRLFDDGYITVTPEHRIEVSRRIREEYENGREYYRHQGQSLAVLPGKAWQRPSSEFLAWHNESVFKS